LCGVSPWYRKLEFFESWYKKLEFSESWYKKIEFSESWPSTENNKFQFIVTQILCFLLTIIGAAVLLEHATHNSRIQPMIRHAMTRFIMTSEYPASSTALRMIQENVSIFVVHGDHLLIQYQSK
jgi:hypothetical protein